MNPNMVGLSKMLFLDPRLLKSDSFLVIPTETLLSLEGAVDHWAHCEDRNYHSSPSVLFRLMTSAHQAAGIVYELF